MQAFLVTPWAIVLYVLATAALLIPLALRM